MSKHLVEISVTSTMIGRSHSGSSVLTFVKQTFVRFITSESSDMNLTLLTNVVQCFFLHTEFFLKWSKNLCVYFHLFLVLGIWHLDVSSTWNRLVNTSSVQAHVGATSITWPLSHVSYDTQIRNSLFLRRRAAWIVTTRSHLKWRWSAFTKVCSIYCRSQASGIKTLDCLPYHRQFPQYVSCRVLPPVTRVNLQSVHSSLWKLRWTRYYWHFCELRPSLDVLSSWLFRDL